MKKFLAVLLIFLLAVQVAGFSAPFVSAEPDFAAEKNGMKLIADEGDLALYADTASGNVLVYDRSKDVSYATNPIIPEGDESVSAGQKRLMASQIDILYYDAAGMEQERNGYIACVSKGGLSHKQTKNGIDFIYNFAAEGFEITVSYDLTDGYLSVKIPIDKIKEKGKNELTEISLLPYFNSGSFTDKGFMLIPDGSGSIIEMNNGRSNGKAIKERVYGDDVVVNSERKTEIKQNMTLPVIGINRNDNGSLAVITEGDAAAYVNAYTGGMKKNFNCAYFSFEYRQTGTFILDSSSKNAKTVRMISEEAAKCDAFSVRYYMMSGNASYSNMASCYSKYLQDEKGLKNIKASENLPFYVDCYGALRKKGTFLCIPITVTVPLTTYSQAKDMMNALNKSGIENIVFSYDGWTPGGISGKMPVAGKYESKLGGKKQFNKLEDAANKLGVTFLPNVNTVDLVMSGNGYSKNRSAAASLDGTPGLQYTYNLYSRLRDKTLTPYYLIAPSNYRKIIQKYYKKYDLDTKGISLKKNGNLLYSDYHKESCDRLQSIKYQEAAFNEVNKRKDVLLTSTSNAYAAVKSDYIMEAPTSDSGYDITDYSVPFYQLVFSGKVNYSVESVNLSVSTRESFLKALETGSGLCYAFTAQNFAKTENTYLAHLYNSNYKDWLDIAARQYAELNEVYKKTEGGKIVAHNRIANDVTETTFENGLKIRFNYTTEDYTDANGTISAMNYQIIERG